MKEVASLTKDEGRDPFIKFLLRSDNVLIMQWKGFSKPEQIKQGHEKVLDLISEHKVEGIVEDIVNFTGPFSEVNQWFITNWVPRALKVGLKKAAVLMSTSVFTQLSVEQLKENTDFKKLGLGYRIFGEVEKAATWIKETEKVEA